MCFIDETWMSCEAWKALQTSSGNMGKGLINGSYVIITTSSP